jgi:hypothetical protein
VLPAAAIVSVSFTFLPSWESKSVVEDLLFCSFWKSVVGVFVCVRARAVAQRYYIRGRRFFSCFHNSSRNQNEQSRKRWHSFSLYNVGSRCSSTAGQWRYYCCFFLLFCCLSHCFFVYLLFSQYYWLLSLYRILSTIDGGARLQIKSITRFVDGSF